MTKLLHLDSSIQTSGSISRKLSAAVVERLATQNVGLSVQYRDLALEPLPHLSQAVFAALAAGAPAEGLGETDLVDVGLSNAVLDEFLEADIIVIGSPFYNYSIPSSLKAWIDRIVVVGRTFTYGGGAGPVGLARGKRVIVTLARGGVYSPDLPQAVNEHAETYLRSIFSLVGIDEVEFVVAEGLGISEEYKATAIEAAEALVAELAA